MKIKEAQSQWMRRAYDIAYATTKDPEFALAFASKMLTQTRLNPTHSSANGVGIAQLPEDVRDTANVDPLNPEEALTYAAQRDADILAQTGNVAAAMVGELAQVDQGQAQHQLRSIQENQTVVQQSLFSGNQEEGTFTELESPETRFREAVRGKDLARTNSVIDEMAGQRVAQRAATR